MRRPVSFSLAKRTADPHFSPTSSQSESDADLALPSVAVIPAELRPTSRYTVRNAARILAPSFFMLVFAAAAHAQAGVDFNPLTTLGTSIITFFKFVGGAMAVGGIIFAAFEWFGRHDVSKAIGGVVGALIGAVIIGAASVWGSSTTGQAVQ